MKKCKDCGVEKPLEEFHLQSKPSNPRTRHMPWYDGRRNDCKECHKKKNYTNKEKIPVEERRAYMNEYMKKRRAAAKTL